MKFAFSPTVIALVFGLVTSASAQFSGNGASPSGTPSVPVQSSGTGDTGSGKTGDTGVLPSETPFYQQSNPIGSGSGGPTASPYGGSVTNFTLPYRSNDMGAAPMPHYWLLIGSILLLALSLYLFMQSIELQRFAFRRIKKNAPNPSGGLQLVWGSAVVVVLSLAILSLFDYVQQNPAGVPFWKEENESMLAFHCRLLFFHRPLSLVPAFALASLLPSALAAYKFLIVRTFGRGHDRSETGTRFSIGSALIGFVVAIINFGASIVGLITFWKAGK